MLQQQLERFRDEMSARVSDLRRDVQRIVLDKETELEKKFLGVKSHLEASMAADVARIETAVSDMASSTATRDDVSRTGTDGRLLSVAQAALLLLLLSTVPPSDLPFLLPSTAAPEDIQCDGVADLPQGRVPGEGRTTLPCQCPQGCAPPPALTSPVACANHPC